jgi:outer membrane biosynthesis protein TonB
MSDKRVSISYTVDLQEVPQRVKILLDELAVACRSLGDVSATAGNKSVEPGEDRLAGIKEIVRLKVLLGKAQERADDCFNILKGYLVMINQESQPAPEPAPQPAPQQQPSAAPAPPEKPKKKKAKKKVKKKTAKKKKAEE